MKLKFLYTIKITACLLTLLCILYCCEKPADITLPPHQSKLVLHGYVEIGQPFKVAVSKTMINSGIIPPDSTLFVKNALVILYKNEIIADTLVYNNTEKRYVSARIIATIGMTYKITVQAPDFTAVEARAKAPSFVNTNSIKHDRSTRLDGNGMSMDDVTFSFTDPAGEKNYYLAELNKADPFFPGNYFFCVYTYDVAVEQHQGALDPFENSSCIPNKKLIIPDGSFDGTTKELRISTASINLEPQVLNNRVYPAYLKKYSISEDFYKYIKDDLTLDALNDNPFAQPYTTPGNVKNGYGLFTVFSAVTDTLR